MFYKGLFYVILILLFSSTFLFADVGTWTNTNVTKPIGMAINGSSMVLNRSNANTNGHTVMLVTRPVGQPGGLLGPMITPQYAGMEK